MSGPAFAPGAIRQVTSLTNERVKFIRSLDMRKVRKETGLFTAEGMSILLTAREHGFHARSLVMLAGSAESGLARGLVESTLRAGGEVLEVSAAVLEKLSAKDNPQTMLGVFDQRWAPLPAPASVGASDTWLALEEVRDPGNLGTIVRTADAFGVAGVILAGNCVDPFSREAIRATMGSVFAVPLARASREDLLALQRSWRGDVAGTHLSGTHDIRDAKLRSPVLVVMGSEGPGLSDEAAAACTRLVKIPMSGRLDSLNLSIATAITLFEVRRPFLSL